MTSFSLGIQIISILAILVPASIAMVHVKTAGIIIRLFFLFLVIGFITDVTMFTLVRLKSYDHLPIIFNAYSLVESLFFYWFVLQNITSHLLRLTIKILLLLTPVLWILFIVFFYEVFPSREIASQVFSMTYEILVSFLAGFALLKIVEHGESMNSYNFWILSGIFFYCFCTFFIMGFLNTLFAFQIWFLNNIFNIITYGFYSMGLWAYHKSYRRNRR